MLLVLRRSHPIVQRTPFTHERARFRVPVGFVPGEMVDFGIKIGPDHSVGATSAFRFAFSRELTRSCRAGRGGGGGAG